MKNKEKATKFSSAGVKKWILNNSIYIVLVALIVIITAVDSTFLSLKNLWFIVTQASTRMILALGVAGIIVLGGADLSIGRMIGVSAVISASLLQSLDNPNIIFPGLDLPVILPVLLVVLISAIFSVSSGQIGRASCRERV